MEQKEPWINKWKEKLENYSEPLPVSGWEQLEKALMPHAERKIYLHRRWAVAASIAVLVALASSVTLYYLSTPAADEVSRTAVPALSSTTGDASSSVTGDEPSSNVQQPKDRLAKAKSVPPAQKRQIHQEVIARREEVRQEGTAHQEDVHQEAVQEDIHQETARQEETVSKDEQPKREVRRSSDRGKLNIPAKRTSTQKGKWSVALFAGNSGKGESAPQQPTGIYMTRVNMATVASDMVNMPKDQTVVFDDGVPYLTRADEIVDMQHHQPLTLGLSVRKSIGSGFALETGLTYTLLASDATIAHSDKQIEQQLHYLGIPLKVNWNFFEAKRFTFYVSGGGTIEKCIYGKFGSEKVTVRPLQLSVSGSVGAQMNFTKHIGIYAEPGIAYYFDDGSDTQTIRKDTPFNFHLQAGIRLTY